MVELVANAPGRTITLTFEYNVPELPQRWQASGDMDTPQFLEFLNGLGDYTPSQSGLKPQYSDIEAGIVLVQALRVCGLHVDLPVHWEEALQEMYDEISENEQDGDVY